MLKFKLTRKTLPVELEDENGVTTKYTLRQMDGAQRDEFLNDQARRMEVVGTNPDGTQQTKISDFTGLHAKLLSLCLTEDATGKPPTLATIQSWPADVQQELYKEAKKLNGLGEAEAAAKEAAKKD